MKTKATEKELLELETQYWQALKDQDFDTALRLTADPVIIAGAQGVSSMDKKSMDKMMGAAQNYTLEDFRIDDVKVSMLGDDVAVLAYKVHEDLTVDGKPVKLDAADASTWVRKNGSWVCALHTESILGDPFGRDKRAAK